MSFLQGLHGVVAVVLLCGLLFAEESGVPLPFAPGEIVLLAAGLLIAAGGLDPYVFIPLAMLACIAGSVVGYSWARLVGRARADLAGPAPPPAAQPGAGLATGCGRPAGSGWASAG